VVIQRNNSGVISTIANNRSVWTVEMMGVGVCGDRGRQHAVDPSRCGG
jgi:hypothetical protein